MEVKLDVRYMKIIIIKIKISKYIIIYRHSSGLRKGFFHFQEINEKYFWVIIERNCGSF